MKRVTLTICCVLLTSSLAFSHWDEGEPFKMHFPQLPDPLGWDVNFMTPPEGSGRPAKVLADDWLCTESGPVSDIHFWFSSRDDLRFEIQKVRASIHDDDRSGQFSKPGQLLWQRDFSPEQVQTRVWGCGPQGWYDPNTGEYELADHYIIYQANIIEIPEPFVQEADSIYWLDLSVQATRLDGTDPVWLGWKTADVNKYPDPYTGSHFEDDAVWTDVEEPGLPLQWQELRDPITGNSLDLAFVITPEPGTLVLLVGGGLVGLLSRRRSRQ